MPAVAVDSALAALAELRAAADRVHPYHLVLTDALMPDVDGFRLAEEIARDERLRTLKVILLTSAGSAVQQGRQASHLAATLAKPVKQSDLLDAIVTAFAGPVPVRRQRTKARLQPGRARTRPLRVLVAEDNLTNQKLVDALLKQKGHHVSMVSNGRQAIDRAQRESFDIVLMDVQMPEVGGFEATAAIREHERPAGKHTPILALTASAMAGDREACLAAGMDGYVSKPLRPDELFAAIDALCVPPEGASASGDGAGPTPPRVVDLATLLAGFDGNTQLVGEVVDVFLQDAPGMLVRLRDAARARAAGDIASAAHAIKGAAGLFSLGPAYQSARDLELRAKEGDLTSADTACADVEADIAQLMTELRDLRKGLGA
jgi:CheY-like chemotaxis protein